MDWPLIVIGIELLIIVALALLASWALNQALLFGRDLINAESEILTWQEKAVALAKEISRFRNPPRGEGGRFVKAGK